jgi:hypothetical protein
MGEVVAADPAQPLVYRLLGDKGWEEVSLYDADRRLWTRNLHEEAGFSNRRMRLRFGGARIKDRYRAAYWQGEIVVTGAALLGHRGVGFDHPEQCAWRKDATTIGFQSATHGDVDGVELSLSDLAGSRIDVRANLYGYVKVGDPLQPPPHIDAPSVNLSVSGCELLASGAINLDIPGVELRISLECVTEKTLARDLEGEIHIDALKLEKGREHPLFITARQTDQSRIWTSPLFLSL